MAFDSFADFIAMGGHAPYVWSSWVITLLLILGLVWHARLERRQLVEGLKRRARRERARQQQGEQATVYPVDQGESS
ncbi:MAG: heme exporter protein CcmD [Pseudomonadota bacterium]|jgi:heme exporter protein D